MKKIALIPVYNEESTIRTVLQGISPLVDLLVLVDDGSTDSSLQVAEEWARRTANVEILKMPGNRGMSSALKEGLVHLCRRLERGELEPEDILFTLDADGQHDPREIEALFDYMRDRGLDVALTCRDFALYPRYKRLGNRLMTLWGRIWSGFPYRDVESGFRGMRLKVVSPLLDYYTGCRYSCAQEIAVLTARLGFRVDNRFRTVIQRYRSQTRLHDVCINAMLALWAFVRWSLHRRDARRRAAAIAIVTSDPL